MKNKTYIIGEIGQNHNGSVDIAKAIIELITKPIIDDYTNTILDGINAIKLTKRDLKYELTDEEMNRIYDSPNSFGKTYGEHREFLELSYEEHLEIYKFAKSHKIDVIETLCSPSCIEILNFFKPDYLKVASRDLTNIPLLEALANTHIPIILSTGMADKIQLNRALEVIEQKHNNISILHCVSEYPTHPERVNLLTIPYLIENYSKYNIGFSDHSIGILAPSIAVGLGAKIIEKHITLDRRMKGTDQLGSLGPDGVKRMIRDIRLTEKHLGTKDFFIEPSVRSSKEKLERSVASKIEIKKGSVITLDDIHLLSPGTGITWDEKDKILGKKALNNIKANSIIKIEEIE